jgi:hypothetical protein
LQSSPPVRRVAELGVVRRLITSPVKPSFLSALSGWFAGSVSFVLAWGLTEGARDFHEWLGLLLIAAIYSAPMVLAVWLIALWPLYVRVPASSPLWHPAVCILSGAAAGAHIYVLVFRFAFGFPPHSFRAFPHLIVGAVVGAVTCAVGVRFKRNEPNVA